MEIVYGLLIAFLFLLILSGGYWEGSALALLAAAFAVLLPTIMGTFLRLAMGAVRAARKKIRGIA